MFAAVILFSAVITAPPIVSDRVLEPSVENEVMHALDRAPKIVPVGGILATNALALVSCQRADGRFFDGTNDITHAAVRTLRWLAGIPCVGAEEMTNIVEAVRSADGLHDGVMICIDGDAIRCSYDGENWSSLTFLSPNAHKYDIIHTTKTE